MIGFPGVEKIPYNPLTAVKPINVTAVQVRVYRTLYNDIYYSVEGRGSDGVWYEIIQPYTDAHAALDLCDQIQEEIRRARMEWLADRRERTEQIERNDQFTKND